jgi:hypothetical protein
LSKDSAAKQAEEAMKADLKAQVEKKKKERKERRRQKKAKKEPLTEE